MSSLDLTRNWLNSVLRPYPARERLVKEVMDILQSRRTLSVKTDAFTFDTGQTALLLLLHGTLPITYRGATYQIPVHVWVPHEYPRGPPLAFVVPTKDMGVRKGREVDPSGRIREEVVEQWWGSWQDKGIDMLLKQLAAVFSAVPPVYAKPPDQAASSSPARPALPKQPLALNGMSSMQPQLGPGYPNGSPASPVRGGGGGPSGMPQGPPPPARPFSGPPLMQPAENLPQYRAAPTPPPIAFSPAPLGQQNMQDPYQPQTPPRHTSMPYPGHAVSTSSPQASRSPPIPDRPAHLGHGRTGSLPPQPPQAGPSVPQRPAPPPVFRPSDGSASPAQYLPPGDLHRPPAAQPSSYPPHLGQPFGAPAPSGTYLPNGQVPASVAASSTGQPYQHPYMAHPPGQRLPQQTAVPQGLQGAPRQSMPQAAPAQIASRQPMLDLMSAADEADTSASPTASADPHAPPPVPPSKPPPPSLLHLHSILLPHLNATLPPLLHHLQTTRAQLLERKEDLASGEPAVKDEMARLEAVKKVCDATGKKMEDVVRRGDERVRELEMRGEISVDEVVCGISIVHNQLIDLVAEDNAIEDTIYHMARALDTERIDLDRFLKSVRSLAREQYMKRALIERILQGMGQTQGW